MSNKSSNLAWRISDEFYTMMPAGSLPKPLTAGAQNIVTTPTRIRSRSAPLPVLLSTLPAVLWVT